MLAVGRWSSGACSRAFQRARAMRAAFCSRPISLVSTTTEANPGQGAHPAGDLGLICPLSGQDGVVRATRTRTTPSGLKLDRCPPS